MIYLKKTIIILICIFFISMIGTLLFIRMDNTMDEEDENLMILENDVQEENIIISNSIEVSEQDKKTSGYGVIEKLYVGTTLSEIFDGLEIIKKVMINDYNAKCR